MTARRPFSGPLGLTRRADKGSKAAKRLGFSTWEGWEHAVWDHPLEEPERMTVAQLRELSDRELGLRNRQRRTWHANLPTIETVPFERARRDLVEIIEASLE